MTAKAAIKIPKDPGSGGSRIRRKMWQQRYLYLLIIPGLLSMILFTYVPLYGIQLAFKNYRVSDGIWGSPWNNLAHFKLLFSDPEFWQVTRNTFEISVMRIVTGFPIPIILSLMLNELRGSKFKRISQTLLCMPNFVSWIVIAGLIYGLFSTQIGVYGKLYQRLFGEMAPSVLGVSKFFRLELYISSIWKTAGWGMIVYLAGMSGIDPALYESAELDGAGRFRKMCHITVPALKFAITLNLIMAFGGVMSVGFDQVFNLYSAPVYKSGDIIDTFVYRMGIASGRYDISTAISLFKNIISAVLMISADRIAKLLGQEGFF